MKKLYKKFLGSLMAIPVKTENLKTSFAEWYAIIRKKPLYKNVKWSKAQQREFDAFWKKSYGKKISNRWHRLYQSMNGIYRYDYIPEFLYSTKIERKCNDFYYGKVLCDKTMLGVLFDHRLPNVRTPKTYVANSFGVYYDSERRVISEARAKEILSDLGEAIMKPTVDSSSGHNIKVLDLHGGVNIKDQTTTDALFKMYGSNFVIQEKLRPHEELAHIYPDAINTFRVISYTLDSKIYVAPVSLRIGSGGSSVDNIHSGGMVISVNSDGSLKDKAYRLGYGDRTETFTKHPNTGVVFKEVTFSFADRLTATARALHGLLSNIGFISWDFTVDDQGNIVVIEVNLRGQSVWFPQMISGEALFGENTGKYLKQLGKRRS